MTTQIVNNPLVIEDFPAESNQIARGYTIKRRIIIKNAGGKRADIDIWIAAIDAKSEPLLSWCSFSAENPLKLEPRENREIVLYFEVPAQAIPDLYNYELLIEAPIQYPDKIFRRPQQLRVLRSERDAEWSNEPGFILQPLTNSANPHPIQAGEKLELKVIVENRSKRVDRFYLNCPELTNDWFTIRYPESRLETSGLVKETDGLELNPNTTGEITLIFHPPRYTPAGNYFPTIRLISSNKDELMLLDVVYLQLLPHENLDIELSPQFLRFPSQTGVFDVKLINQGNIIRDLKISASDRQNLFSYTPESSAEPILPGHNTTVPLRVKPRKWWHRPLWGKGLEFNFDIELENKFKTDKPPALPKDLTQGTLIWEPRPWWQVWLPIILLLLLALGLISVSAFLFWQKTFINPKIDKLEPSQKVYQETDRKPVSLNLSIEHLSRWELINWRFRNIGKLSSVKIIPQTREGLGKIISYDYNQMLNWCQQQNDKLNCANLPTETNKAGDYTFKVELYSSERNKPVDSKDTDTIVIKPAPPIPIPKILKFFPNKLSYQEMLKEQVLLSWKISNPKQVENIILTQQGTNGSSNQKTFIQCIPQEFPNTEVKPNYNTGRIEKVLNENVLLCQGIPTNLFKAGKYTFKLEVFSKESPKQAVDTKQTDTITIQPVPVPKLMGQILSNKSVYEYREPVFLSWRINHPNQIKELRVVQQGSDGTIVKNTLLPQQCRTQSFTQKIPSTTVLPNNLDILICDNVRLFPEKAGNYTYKLEVISNQEPNQPSDFKETDTITIKPLPVPKITLIASTKPFYEAAKNEEIFLNWEISNLSQIKELKLVALAPDGSVSSQLKRYIVTNNSVPSELQKFCILTTNLVCQNVPTGAKQAGDYIFKLTVVPKQGSGEPEITTNTATIKVKPIPPTPINIVYFRVNGQDVAEKQKYIYELNKERKPSDIVLSWKVEDGEDIKVELLPFGEVQKPQGVKNYTLSKPPSSVTITLKVTNKAGEQKTQSVVIETSQPSQLGKPQIALPKKATPQETAPRENSSGTASPNLESPSSVSPNLLSPVELPPESD
jgi:hypothetical protein